MQNKQLQKILILGICGTMAAQGPLTVVHAENTDEPVITDESQTEQNIPIDEAHFPDASFRQWIKENLTNGSDTLTQDVIRRTEGMYIRNSNLTSLRGIEYFKNLIKFQLISCPNITSFHEIESLNKLRVFGVFDCDSVVDYSISGMPSLDTASIESDNVKSVSIMQCNKLESLHISGTQIYSTDAITLSDTPPLKQFYFSNNNYIRYGDKKGKITKVDLSRPCFSELQSLTLHNLACDTLDLSKIADKLQFLDLQVCDPAIKSYSHLYQCHNLISLRLESSLDDDEFDVSQFPNLLSLDLSLSHGMPSDFSGAPNLESVSIELYDENSENETDVLDFSHNEKLHDLSLSDNLIKYVNLKGCNKLSQFLIGSLSPGSLTRIDADIDLNKVLGTNSSYEMVYPDSKFYTKAACYDSGRDDYQYQIDFSDFSDDEIRRLSLGSNDTKDVLDRDSKTLYVKAAEDGSIPEAIPVTYETGGGTVAYELRPYSGINSGNIIGKSSVELNIGDKQTLKVSDQLKEKNLRWKSSDPSTVSVDKAGKITAKKQGKATITVSDIASGKAEQFSVTVLPAKIKEAERDLTLYSPEDGWGIPNNHMGFNYPAGYAISKKIVQERLNMSLTELLSHAFKSWTWGGSCYGMSTLSVGRYLNKLDQDPTDMVKHKGADLAHSYDNYANVKTLRNEENRTRDCSVYYLDSETQLTDWVEKIQIGQFSDVLKSCLVFKTKGVEPGNYYSDFIAALSKKNRTPYILCMAGGASHAVATDNSYVPFTVDGEVYVPLNDPNHCFVQTGDNSLWQKFYGAPETFVGDDGLSYKLASYFVLNQKTGRFRYYENGVLKEDDKDYDAFLRNVYVIDASQIPANYYTDKLDFKATGIQNVSAILNRNALIQSNGETLLDTRNGAVDALRDDCTFLPYTEDGTNDIHYVKGTLEFPPSDSPVSFETTGSVTLLPADGAIAIDAQGQTNTFVYDASTNTISAEQGAAGITYQNTIQPDAKPFAMQVESADPIAVTYDKEKDWFTLGSANNNATADVTLENSDGKTAVYDDVKISDIAYVDAADLIIKTVAGSDVKPGEKTESQNNGYESNTGSGNQNNSDSKETNAKPGNGNSGKNTTSNASNKEDAHNGGSNGGSSSANASSSESSAKADTRMELYELQNLENGEHFYTISKTERDALTKTGWKYKGVLCKVPYRSKAPVYRLLNPNTGLHHFTTNEAEKKGLLNSGWVYEGIGWYSEMKRNLPVYRMFNSATGQHRFVTTNKLRDSLIKENWTAEGIGFFD